MNKIVVALLCTFLLSNLCFSQSHYNSGSGEILLSNGYTTIGINIGTEQNSRNDELAKRVVRLERAVRDLQMQVYNLSQADFNPELWECSITAFGTTFFGQGETANMAKSTGRKSCLAKNNSMFCEEKDFRCSRLR